MTAAKQGYECPKCGEFIPAGSVVPDECPQCGSTRDYRRVG